MCEGSVTLTWSFFSKEMHLPVFWHDQRATSCISNISPSFTPLFNYRQNCLVFKKKSVVELCWLSFITFKCKCVFLLIDEKCLGLIFMYFESTEAALIWNQFALWSHSREPWCNDSRSGLSMFRSSINMDAGCVFSIKPMGDSGLCKHTSLLHQMHLLASCFLDTNYPARTQTSNLRAAALWKLKMWHLFVY